MINYINRQDAINELQVKVFHNLTDEYYGTMQVLNELPAADVVPIAEIYDAGYKGEEVQFHIGGRLFAIRELAQ